MKRWFFSLLLCCAVPVLADAPPKQLKTVSFTPNLAISNRMFDYFMAEPGIRRTGESLVPQGIIAFVERRDRWREFFERMPAKPDFLEIRTEMTLAHSPDFVFEPREIDLSIDAALAAGIDKVQISPVFASNLKGFMDKAFGPGKAAEMTDSTGTPLAKAFETTVFYSYSEVAGHRFMERIIRDIVGHYQQDPRGQHVTGWNFKYMTNSDWLYPAAQGFYDYSAPALAAYREFLKQKYGSVGELNRKYGSSFPAFDAVEMPPPPFGTIDCSPRWREFQEFRRLQPLAAMERTRRTIRRLDPSRRIIAWNTTAIWAASRDTVILDDAIASAKKNPEYLPSLTCFDYLNPAGEIWGQLALHDKTPVNIEPVFNTAQSYLRTFYNCLRFPVAQVNWLYVMPRHDPRERPWVVWVLNRGALLDEAAKAELVQSPVAALLSYSDHFLQVSPELRSQFLEPVREFLHEAEAARLQLAWVTDYSDGVDFNRYRTIVIPGAALLRPEAVEKLRNFVSAGGNLLLAGECVEYDLDTGRADWPLYRALNRQLPPEGRQEWNFGKGRVIQLPDKSRVIEELSALGAVSPVEISPGGPGAFLKKGEGAWYVGLINAKRQTFRGRVTIPSLPEGDYRAADLVDGRRVNMSGKGFEIELTFPDEVRFIKIVPVASPIELPEAAGPKLLKFREVAGTFKPFVPLAGEEGGERWIPAGPAAVRPVLTPVREQGERFFRFDFPTRSTAEAGAAYVPFALDHLVAVKARQLSFKLRSDAAGTIDFVLPERNWNGVRSCRVSFNGAPGVWQEFSVGLDDFSGKPFPWNELRGELLIYSGRGETAAPKLSFELSGVRFE